MKLTTFSDYALRVLMYAGAAGDRLVTIEETARVYKISQAHLMKVVNLLINAGYLRGVRGRSGGFTLARRPEEINLGAVIRETESDFALVECFTPANECLISSRCRLPKLLNKALATFICTFDEHTLADIMLSEQDFAQSVRPTVAAHAPILPTRFE
ncbi:transcriptional regulator, BadM/Rrf2 family [Hoeflea sp. IMCC20628]|uniref:RrF2 family transcriptional regulator n=1 Tax=Hoeflea sp. IMCC20628 TaxID=1620421 RepID=UPI00063AF319|nr:Rrf2 family transcriptional regulator [Hoeflea sp. IMCC20628]AKH98810.1 transcriptional regulator, BadM/Rrf2 family [Hoeflea sp. IMCC20628]